MLLRTTVRIERTYYSKVVNRSPSLLIHHRIPAAHGVAVVKDYTVHTHCIPNSSVGVESLPTTQQCVSFRRLKAHDSLGLLRSQTQQCIHIRYTDHSRDFRVESESLRCGDSDAPVLSSLALWREDKRCHVHDSTSKSSRIVVPCSWVI